MMDSAYISDSYLPVLHHPGTGYVKWDTWDNFLGGKNFKGVRKPNGTVTSSDRDLFVAMGRVLRTENISYNLAYQVYYNTSTAGYWVDPEDISSMRCDGVVEYIYEWYGFRVYGSDDKWDVTRNDYWVREHHSGGSVTPETQVNYLSLVTTEVPW